MSAPCATCSAHPDIAKVAFTGSGPVGRQVNLAAAHNVKPATLELGGKSALIVFDDADIDKAVEWAMVRHLPFCVEPPPQPHCKINSCKIVQNATLIMCSPPAAAPLYQLLSIFAGCNRMALGCNRLAVSLLAAEWACNGKHHGSASC